MRFLDYLAAVASWRGLVAACLVVAAPGLAAAQACPDYSAPALSELSYTVDELAESVEVDMLAGGDVDISDCNVAGYGHFVTAPDFELTLSDLPDTFGLMFGVQSACDTMLLVNGPDGQYSFNDDFDGFNPVVARLDGNGTYDIWVGTYDTEVCDAKLMIVAGEGYENLDLMAGQDWQIGADSGQCPDPSLDGAALSLTAADLSAGHVENMLAGGDVDLSTCAQLPGFGNVITAPDYDLDIDGLPVNGQFTITAESDCDVVLLVNDAQGEWQYNDDANNSTNAELKLTAGNGRYDVWVGTYGTEVCDTVLSFKDAGIRRTK